MRKLLSIVVAALLLAAVPFQAFANENCNPEVISLKDVGSNKYMSWKLEIPQIKGLENRKVERSINSQFKKTVESFKKELLVEAKKAYKEAEKAGYPFHPYEAQTTYAVHFLNCNLLSLTMDLYSYTGGAHGNTIRLAFNYDLKTGKELGYKDIFRECVDYKKVIIDEVSKKIMSNPENFFPDALETVKNFTDEQPFYITKDGIVVFYGLYEIAPYVAGIQEFFIPFSAFTCD
jgi:AAA15 family ATPase/GTPase